MKVLVCGSRDWRDYDAIYNALSALPGEHERITILHGAASRKEGGIERSADMLADHAARELGFDVESFPADWERYGMRAGVVRNLQMLDERPDLVIAFHRNGSRGTRHTITEAHKRGVPVEVHQSASQPQETS